MDERGVQSARHYQAHTHTLILHYTPFMTEIKDDGEQLHFAN